MCSIVFGINGEYNFSLVACRLGKWKPHIPILFLAHAPHGIISHLLHFAKAVTTFYLL